MSDHAAARSRKVIRELSVCCPIFALPLLGFGLRWCQEPCSFQHVVDEPEGFAEKLQALPHYVLNDTEHDRFYRDGILVIPRQLQEEDFHRRIIAALWEGGIPPYNNSLTNNWVTNGALRALVRHGPFGSLAASALNVSSVRLTNTATWYKMRARRPEPSQRWHVDDHLTNRSASPTITVWIALTDAPDSIEFILGSHLMQHDCAYYASPTDNVEQECIQHRYVQSVEAMRGESALQKYSFKAGDVVVIHGKLWHRGRSHREKRFAISLRFVPNGMRFEREFTEDISRSYYRKFLPRECEPLHGPLFPVAHPPDMENFQELQWPLTLTWGDFLLARMWRIYYELRVVSGRLSFREC